uniref:Uncharacterized protein n=1 Tax=Colobus angolensis palliatus TaxID=336983 RepID=A0A2K5IHX9_COLAP
MPLHSSLGNRVRVCLKKKKKIPQIISCRDFTNQAYFDDSFPGIMVEGVTVQIHSSHKHSQIQHSHSYSFKRNESIHPHKECSYSFIHNSQKTGKNQGVYQQVNG